MVVTISYILARSLFYLKEFYFNVSNATSVNWDWESTIEKNLNNKNI